MTNSIKPKNRIPLFQRMGEFFFVIYLITLYLFVDREDTIIYSNIAFILFGGFSVLSLLQRKKFYIGKNMLMVYIAFTWMQATTFWAYNTQLAGDRMSTMWLLFVLCFLTYNLFYEKENAHEFLLRGLYIAGIALLVYSVNLYGISGTIELMTSSRVRFGGEINQENTFGMMNATTIMIAFYYILYKKSYKLFHILIASGAFLFAMASGSRKALLMMCVGVLFLIYKRYGLKRFYKVIVVGAIVTILFIAVIQLPAFDFIRERMEYAVNTLTGSGQDDGSSQLRRRMIVTGWQLFKEHILIGYGANNYAIASGFMTYSHNNFIEILVNFGLLGFILYYMVYVTALNSLRKSGKRESKVLMVILLVRIMMEMAMVTYYAKVHWILLAFALIGDSKKTEEEEIPKDEVVEEVQPEETIIEQTQEGSEVSIGDIKKAIEEFMEEERDGICESENYYDETEEGNVESETFVAVPVGKEEYSATVFRQSLSQSQVQGDNGEEAQS